MWVSTGDSSLQTHVVMVAVLTGGDCLFQVLAPVIGRHVDRGARLSELLVAMMIVAPDGGKCS